MSRFKKVAAAVAGIAISASVLTGCGMTTQDRIKLMKECVAAGGSYSERGGSGAIYGLCSTEDKDG